jgi:hypothetical protein
MVLLLRVMLAVCRNMGRESDGTSEHEEYFDAGRETAYNKLLFDIERCRNLLA